MKRKIFSNELKQIRKEIEALQDHSNASSTLFVSIALPEPCDRETLDFAHELCNRINRMNCQASISELLHFPYREDAGKSYEVMQNIPLGVPCIRVYPQSKKQETGRLQAKKRTAIQRWVSLFPFLQKRLSAS